MGYRNKTYVGFDADTDMRCYRLMQAWKANKHIDFNFYNVHDINSNPNLTSESTIKRQLRERFENTKNFVLLVGEKTKNLYKYVRWEIDQAIERDLPIIVVNLNMKREPDENLCPPIIRNGLAMHVSFNAAIVKYALDDWEDSHYKKRRENDSQAYHYKTSVYKELGL
ncbi:TIR domain-containing protein [Leptothoe sp. PORK10 BA2]|uniref:TIR domain-containing protein n=1 Tax=Leptothoe sp. PORK10 BA2 TaxID=3110254 RepID=UPI002B2005B5|nr:TIR domain-containing protein [Leptothoe sp. PORK10 BA2]MEA5462979.1 TIR domain-containing protein [Leptothoe sp. PORK10 BA2]